MDLGLKGKRVFVTGSSRGIGYAISDALLDEGAEVLINARNQNVLENSYKSMEAKHGRRVSFFCGDMQKRDDIENAADYINNRYGALDILVANIGSGKPNDTNQLNITEWERFFEINVYSAISTLDVMRPLLIKGKAPAVLLISSVVSKQVAKAPVGYAASKSSVRVLNKYLSSMWAEYGIRVNCVLPGNIYFQGGRWEELRGENEEEIEKYISESVPMKRFGGPEEVANAAVFLVSERASFITGAELLIDGGQTSAI